jgi:hypothetical protein
MLLGRRLRSDLNYPGICQEGERETISEDGRRPGRDQYRTSTEYKTQESALKSACYGGKKNQNVRLLQHCTTSHCPNYVHEVPHTQF